MRVTFDDDLIRRGAGISAAKHRLQQAELDDDAEDRLGALADLAGAQAEAVELEQAMSDLDRAIDSAVARGNHQQAVLGLLHKGALLVRTHRLEEGLECFDLALRSASAVGDPAAENEVRIRRALTLGQMGRYPEAIELLDRLLDASDDELEQPRSRLLELKGDLLLAFGREPAAQRAFEQAIEIEDSGPPTRYRIGLGQALFGQGKFADAAETLELALDEAQAGDHQELQSEVLKVMVPVDLAMGEMDRLLQHSRLAQAHAERAGDHVEASIQRGNVISAMLGLGRYEPALALILESIEYVRRRGPRAREILLQIQLGRVYYQLRRYQEAESTYKTALELAEKHRDLRSAATILGRLGALYGEQGDLEAARRYGELALGKIDTELDPEIAAEQQILMALTYRDLAEVEPAVAACRKAIALYQQIGDQAFADQAQLLMAELE